MSVSHLYPNFSNPPQNEKVANSAASQDAVEDIKLAAFEEGYQAGWDDAVKAQGSANSKLTEDFVQNLHDLSFTYQEAFSKVTLGMQPVLTAVVEKILPKIAEQSLGPQIMEQMASLMEAERSGLLEIAVAPDKRETIEALLADQDNVPFTVTEESALSPGQIYIRASGAEREINLDKVIEGVSSAIEAFFHTAKEETDHG